MRDDGGIAGGSEQPPLHDALVQLTFVIHGLLAEHAEAADLSMTQLRLLDALRDDEPTMRALAGALQLEKSSLTGLVDRAERRGLVTRIRGADDARTVHVALAPGGRNLLAYAEARFGAALDDLLAPLGAKGRGALRRGAGAIVRDRTR